MDVDRRRLLVGALGAGTALPAAAALGGAATAGAAPGDGKASLGWATRRLGDPQRIPSGRWTKVAWNRVVLDNDRYFTSAHPTEIRLAEGGLYNLAAEVAWAPKASGIRALRVVQRASVYGKAGEFPVAQASTERGLGAGDLPPGDSQHQQVVLQPGTAQTCFVEVYQNSGGSLNLVTVPISAPSLMITRLGTW